MALKAISSSYKVYQCGTVVNCPLLSVALSQMSLVQSLLMHLILFVTKKILVKYSPSPSRVLAESEQSPSKSEQSPSEVDNNLCSDCTRTVLGLLGLCSDCSDCPRTVLGQLGLRGGE
jgi:hypothetical protein